MTIATSVLASMRLVDTSVGVPSLEDSLAFFTETLGFVQVAAAAPGSAPWAVVADPDTDQRVSLIEADYLPYALSFEAPVDEHDACLAGLLDEGCTIVDRGTSDEATGHYRWAHARDRWHLPLLLSSPDEPTSSQLPELADGDEEVVPRLARLVDVSVPVAELGEATAFWTRELGFEPVDRGELVEYTSLMHPATGQVVCLVENENRLRWWLSLECDDLDRAIERFVDGGGTIDRRGRFETGFRWASGTAVGGIPVTLHTPHEH